MTEPTLISLEENQARPSGRSTDAPEGFVRHDRRSGLTDPWEPIYARLSEDAVVLGLYASEPAAMHAASSMEV